MHRSIRLAALGAAAALALAGCSKPADNEAAAPPATANGAPTAAPGLTLSDAVIKLPPVAGNPGVAYFSATASEPHTLKGVDVGGVERAELHRTVTANGMATMEPVREVPVGPGKPATFAPGGYHVMLFGIAPTLRPGETTDLTVTLENGDKTTVKARIEPAVAAAGDHAHHH